MSCFGTNKQGFHGSNLRPNATGHTRGGGGDNGARGQKKAGCKEGRALDISIRTAICCDGHVGFIKQDVSFGCANREV